MSSIKKRVTIEEYISGGFGVFEDDGSELIGIDRDEMITHLMTKVFKIT